MNHGSKEINTLSALHFMKVITLCENKTPWLFHFPCDSFLLSLFLSLSQVDELMRQELKNLKLVVDRDKGKKKKKVKKSSKKVRASSFEIRPRAYFKFSARVTVYRCSDVAQIIDVTGL